MRASDVLAQHTPTPLDGGLACTCREWQLIRFPGGVDTTAWSFACHQIEMLQDAGYDIVKRPLNPDPGPWATWGGDGVGP